MIDKPGIYLSHKPVGVTSFSVVRTFIDEVARSGGRKLPVCHGGTLDPFAEGLLLMLVGQATRLMDLIHEVPKTYVAEVEWGAETDNGDLLGRVVHSADPSGLDPDQLEAALTPFLGWTEQVPPSTSAKKVGGEPAYKKVHRGEEVTLPPSRVFLHHARWLSHQLPVRSRLALTVRGGFYVRSLARDLGRAIGCGAHLSALRRTEIGPWADPGPKQRGWVHGEGLLPWCASRPLTDDEAGKLRREEPIPGGALRAPSWNAPPGFPAPQGPIRALHRGLLVGLLRKEADTLVPEVVLRGGL